jgi:glutamate-1-semialdehyde aminotransferase
MKRSISYKLNKLIPGGCHTYSKGDNQFSSNAPQIIKYGKGGYVFDNNNNRYLDCGMGLTSVSIGHANSNINRAVKKAIDHGVNFNRPSILELEAAETFLNLVPQHQMIKFAKNGSTVTTAAIKLARAFTGRNLVVFPEEHPFYSYDDWFMIKKKCNAGIPKIFSNYSIMFQQCNIESLKKIFKKYPNKIACVITEPEKNYCNINCKCKINVRDFLNQAADLAHENGALFITDEMITGFKTYFPGSTVEYKLDADLTTWGKGIANGYSFCALTGKKKIMELGGIKQVKFPRVFLISSTHGAETTGLAASIATIKFFKKNKVINKKKKLLIKLSKECQKIINQLNLNKYIILTESKWLVSFDFFNKNNVSCLKTKTFIQQEMLKKKILFQGSFIPCYEHSEKDILKFVNAFQFALNKLKRVHLLGFGKFLKGHVIQPVFKQYN